MQSEFDDNKKSPLQPVEVGSFKLSSQHLDMYQMYAYGKEYKSPRTILLYPRFDNLPEVIATYKHHTENDDSNLTHEILVASVDISPPLNLHANRKKLRSSLKRLAVPNSPGVIIKSCV